MLNKILDFSLNNKLIIILFTITIAAFGIFAVVNIPVGAVPDITNNQVQIITTSTNLSTQEIEQFITSTVEIEMANLPSVKEIRSVSKFGLSVVTVVFDDGIGTYLPRQLIAEKIKNASASIPEGFGTPDMGPITTGLGEIYQYTLDVKPGYEGKYSSMDLRTIQDWVVRRRLSGINGVVEINSWGGKLKQYEISINPTRLKAVDITLMDVFNAIESNNSISGGSYIEKTNQSYFIRGDGQVKSISDIKNIVVSNNDGVPILIKDIAEVKFGYANRFGAITANGKGETVLGQIMMLKDANSKVVINEVKQRVAEIQDNLPEGIFINPILERSELISKTSFTVSENLILGAVIVMFTVLLLLGNLRSALVIASMIPLALLFTISMMYIFGIDANLMSLGALDFGIIIDGAVIIVEFIAMRIVVHRNEISGLQVDERQTLMDKISFEGSSKMMKSAIFGQIIILIVFIPILTLSGVEGKMFQPMALAFSFAIIGAMILGLTWLPVASALFLKPDKVKKRNISDWFMGLAYKSYFPVIKWSYNHKPWVLGAALLSLIFTGVILARIGGEFVPTLDEGDFVIQPVLKTGTSLSKTVEMTTQMENILISKFPEVNQIVSRIGAAEVPTDPMSMEEIDMIIKLNPRNTWVSAKSKDKLAEKFKEELSIIPGVEYEFTQPIEMRFNELITGVRSDIAIKVFGDDLDYINAKANEIKNLIVDIPGASDVIMEKTAGLPQIKIEYNRKKVAQYGIDMKVLNNYLSTAFGGQIAGVVFEGEKRFDMVVRFQKNSRQDIDDIKRLYVPISNGQQIPLEEVAKIEYTEGPAKISRENTQRRVVVSVNTRGRDLQSVVEDIQAKVNKNISLKPGNYITYGGQFENLENATIRLKLAVPLSLLLIFIFLHFAFKSLKDALLIFTAIPLSVVGGVVLLWLRDMPFSVSAGIGFIALFGIAVLNGIVLIEHFKELQEKGIKDMKELILTGTKNRLRPVMLTAGAAAMGFLPMAISTGAGAEVQRPLATVVIGGLITSTMLTMIALPLLYVIFYRIKKIQFFPFKIVRSKTLLILVPLFISASLFAQNKIYNLNEILDLGIQNSKEIQAYKLKIEQSRVLKSTAFNIDKTMFYYLKDQNNIAINGYPLNVWGIEQNFSFPTLYFAQSKALEIDINEAELAYELQANKLKKNISNNYYKIQNLKNKRAIFQNIDSLYTKLLSNAELLHNKGEYSQLDLLTVKTKQHEFLHQLRGIELEISKSFQQLKALMNYYEDFDVVGDLELAAYKTDNLESNPLFQMIKIESSRIEANLKVEKNKLLPDVYVNYFLGTNNYDNSDYYNGFHVGLAVPIFYGSNKAKIKSTTLALESQNLIAENELVKLKTIIEGYVQTADQYKEYIDYYNSTAILTYDEMMRSAQLSFQSGDVDLFKFVYIFESALNTKMEYIDSVLKYNLLMLEIKYLSN